MLNIVNLLIQIGSIIGLVGLIVTFIRVVSHKHNFLIKLINILLIILCAAIIVASGVSLLAGTVTIYTNPTYADIYFDGKYIDHSPCTIQNVMAGNHNLHVKKDGYNDAYQLVIVDIQEMKTLDVELTKQTGTLEVTANVDGADVYANRVLVGKTPLSEKLGTGTYDLLITKADYADVHETVTISSGSTAKVLVTLSPVIGSVRINSDPAGASVTIDGTLYGKTPLSVDKLPVGQHFVELELDGYEKEKQLIFVANQQGTSNSYVLTPKLGSLFITTEPDGLEVTLDGTPVGKSPVRVDNLIPNKYVVSAKDDAKYSDNPVLNNLLASLSGNAGDYEKTVIVEAGKVTEVKLGGKN